MATSDPERLDVWAGRHVELELKYENGELERLGLDVVPDESADFDRGFLGESTPLARAIMGKTAGSTIAYRAGDIVQVTILSVKTELAGKPEDLSERREETLRKAIRRSDNTNLIIYASSMNSKWGEYDPGILKEDDEEDAKEGGKGEG